MVDSITFDFDNKTITVRFVDGTSQVFTSATKDAYLAAYPNRVLDIEAIGW